VGFATPFLERGIFSHVCPLDGNQGFISWRFRTGTSTVPARICHTRKRKSSTRSFHLRNLYHTCLFDRFESLTCRSSVNCMRGQVKIGKLKLYYRPSTTPSVQKCNHMMKKSRMKYGQHPSLQDWIDQLHSLVTQHTGIYTQRGLFHFQWDRLAFASENPTTLHPKFSRPPCGPSAHINPPVELLGPLPNGLFILAVKTSPSPTG